MAKKQKTEKVEAPVVEAPAVTTTKPKKRTWEVKDRTYVLKDATLPVDIGDSVEKTIENFKTNNINFGKIENFI